MIPSMKEEIVRLLEVTVTLKKSQLKRIIDGVEYWEITFDGQKFLNAERIITYYSTLEVDPSNRIKHEEVDYINIKIIGDEGE